MNVHNVSSYKYWILLFWDSAFFAFPVEKKIWTVTNLPTVNTKQYFLGSPQEWDVTQDHFNVLCLNLPQSHLYSFSNFKFCLLTLVSVHCRKNTGVMKLTYLARFTDVAIFFYFYLFFQLIIILLLNPEFFFLAWTCASPTWHYLLMRLTSLL